MSEQIKVGGRYQFLGMPREDDSVVFAFTHLGEPIFLDGGDFDSGDGNDSLGIWKESDGSFLENHTFREMAFESVDTAKCQAPEHPDSAQLLEARSHEFAVLAGQDRELIKVLLRRLLRELEGGA